MSRPAKFQTYDMRVGEHNIKLQTIARQVLNRELPIRYKIGLRDAILAMKEKERLGFNFNRSLTASLRSRWDVVENATLNFLQEIVDMNDQIEEDSKKNERQLLSLIFTRSTNISLEARVEQMSGLYMRMNFYKKVLEERIKQYDPCRNFLLQCCELMGYLQPGQLLDRYAALIHVFKELYKEYEDRMAKMNKLQEKLSEIKSETDHRNMLLHNEMSELHMKLKNLSTRITYMEYELNEKMDQSTNTEMDIYRVKNSIHRSYVALMNYRGVEPTETDPFLQLEHIETRIQNAQDVIKYIRDETMKQHLNFRRRHREQEGETAKSESFSSTSVETFMTEYNDNKTMAGQGNYNINNLVIRRKQGEEKQDHNNARFQQSKRSGRTFLKGSCVVRNKKCEQDKKLLEKMSNHAKVTKFQKLPCIGTNHWEKIQSNINRHNLDMYDRETNGNVKISANRQLYTILSQADWSKHSRESNPMQLNMETKICLDNERTNNMSMPLCWKAKANPTRKTVNPKM
nr:hypothetical protein BgiMline_019361 [Biomphalaria glabrata]